MSASWLVVLLGLAAGSVLLARIRTPNAVEVERSDGPVTVVVPARDEERSLPVLLRSLQSQGLRPDRILVVDDGSEDRTAEVARAGGAEVVVAPPPPPGWAGKPWACSVGVDAARASGTQTLVFLDADVELGPDGLARLLAEHRRDAGDGLLSIQPHHRTVHRYEQLSAVGNLVSMMGSGAFTPIRRYSPPVAFGPCLVTSVAAYDAAGGHAAVAGEIIEDLHLARCYRAAGRRVRCLAGGSSLSYRMYPDGFGQLVEGWSKNLAGGARLAPLGASIGAALWVTAGCILASAGVEAGWAIASGDADRVEVADLLAYGAFALQTSWSLRRIGTFRWWVGPAFPVALAAFVALFLRSLVLRTVVGRVRWRGRSLLVGPSRG